MPEENIYVAGGTLAPGSGVYIARRADRDLLILCREGRFAYILASRQAGKSSLMVRVTMHLRAEGMYPGIVDLTSIGPRVSIDQWYLALLRRITRQLALKSDLVTWWQTHAHIPSVQRWLLFLEQVLLVEVTGRVVIFIDEIDYALTLPFADDFFSSIFTAYSARVTTPAFSRLSFVLLGVASPSDLSRDPQRPFFGIVQQVELTDFTLAEAYPLAKGFSLPPHKAEQVLTWVLNATSGHPYLTQLLCLMIAESGRSVWSENDVKRVVADRFFGANRIPDSNLQFVHQMLTQRSPNSDQILLIYRDIWHGRQIPDEEQSIVHNYLKLSGVVRSVEGMLQLRNWIYREVFDEAWIKEHLSPSYKRLFTRLWSQPFRFPFITKQATPKQPEQIAEEKIQQAITSGTTRLNLANIGLIAVPESIGQLIHLQDLDISHNQLRTLPEAIGRLKQLRKLNLSQNHLTDLPHSLRVAEALDQLYLHDNPNLNLPLEVLGPTWPEILYSQAIPADPASILAYYRGNQQSRPLNEAKLILVGRGGVGKTSLVRRLVHDTFDPNQKKTDGINITSWSLSLRGEEVRLNVWDFGGQEIMHATHQFF